MQCCLPPILPIQNHERIQEISFSFYSMFNTGRKPWTFMHLHSLPRKNLWRTTWAICHLRKVQFKLWSISIWGKSDCNLDEKCCLMNCYFLSTHSGIPTGSEVEINHPEECITQLQQYNCTSNTRFFLHRFLVVKVRVGKSGTSDWV